MDPNVKDSIVARLKEATNVLVTVSNNPSVDQLAACIGFTLLLNKVGKRGAAVFSGDVPSTLEFLQPDKTIEKNTDSLRDFIIALDKSKADKLRYKVEDKVVKIFITPYRTSISDKDLDFSQGDFNVDVVLALGVHQKSELDEAIVSHGRILHDATVISVNNRDQGNLGTLNWVDLQSSSLSEMMATVGQQLGGAEAFDNQIATALMTGIVAETDRFSNEKTSPSTMKLASELMGAGANQQLIATKLQEPGKVHVAAPTAQDTDDGELTIEHENDESSDDTAKETSKAPEVEDKPSEESFELPEPKPLDDIPTPDTSATDTAMDEPRIDNVRSVTPTSTHPPAMTLEPPTLGGKLTANSEPEHLSLDPSTDPLSVGAQRPQEGGMLSRATQPSLSPLTPPAEDTSLPKPSATDAPQSSTPQSTDKVEDDAAASEPDPEEKAEQIDDARDAVEEAIIEGGDPEKNLEPIKALGSQPVNLDLGHEPATSTDVTAPDAAAMPTSKNNDMMPPANPLNDTAGMNTTTDSFPSPSPTGNVSMPPNPLTTPPSTPLNPPLSTSPFINPNPTSSQPDMPTPTTGTPRSLVPEGKPTDHSGASGPATAPPPVPPPMPPMPSIPPVPPAQPPQQ